jgi:hypothetical protein
VALAAEPMWPRSLPHRLHRSRGTYGGAFSIENANSDFLGECGVIQTIGATALKE